MSNGCGVGEDLYLTSTELKEKFNQAKNNGEHYLVQIEHDYFDFVASHIHSIDCFGRRELAAGVKNMEDLPDALTSVLQKP